MLIEAWDLRSGGHFCFVQSNDQGNRYSFTGVFHVARENDLIIQTFEFEGYPDLVGIETLVNLGLGRCDHGVRATRARTSRRRSPSPPGHQR
jgi:uncharacterized protein YndB with AHSA1/START domain